MKINENGDLVLVNTFQGRTPDLHTVATAAKLKAAYAERGMVVISAVHLTAGPNTPCIVSVQIDGEWVEVIKDGQESVCHIVEASGIRQAALKEAPQ